MRDLSDLSNLTLTELRGLAGDLARAIAARLGQSPERNSAMRLNKPDLIAAVAAQCGVSKAVAGQIIDELCVQITTAAAEGATVALHGFGIFTPRTRAARIGRNPATGAAVEIPASTSLTFKASKKVGA